jgi:hypothetical protein
MNQTAISAILSDSFHPRKEMSYTPYAGLAQCTKGAAALPDVGSSGNGSNSSSGNNTSSRNGAAGRVMTAGAAWLLLAAVAAAAML